MKPIKFIAEVRKYQMMTDTSDAKIRQITGWSASTMRRRFSDPEKITLGEAAAIKDYLGMK